MKNSDAIQSNIDKLQIELKEEKIKEEIMNLPADVRECDICLEIYLNHYQYEESLMCPLCKKETIKIVNKSNASVHCTSCHFTKKDDFYIKKFKVSSITSAIKCRNCESQPIITEMGETSGVFYWHKYQYLDCQCGDKGLLITQINGASLCRDPGGSPNGNYEDDR